MNDAQKAYVEHFIQGDPDLAKLPVLPPPRRLRSVGVKTIRQAL
ncbi:hypothetical protein ACNKHK_27650 [Shigella flexneri]